MIHQSAQGRNRRSSNDTRPFPPWRRLWRRGDTRHRTWGRWCWNRLMAREARQTARRPSPLIQINATPGTKPPVAVWLGSIGYMHFSLPEHHGLAIKRRNLCAISNHWFASSCPCWDGARLCRN